MNGDQTLTEFPRTQIPKDAFVLLKPANRTNPTMLHCQLYLHEQKTNHNNVDMWLSTTGSGDKALPVTKKQLVVGPVNCAMMDPLEMKSHFLNSCRPLHKLRAKLFQAASERMTTKNPFTVYPMNKKTILLMQLCSLNPAIANIIYDMFLVRKSLIHC